MNRCGNTNELGTCTLPAGHTGGHHDERSPDGRGSAQWHDRSLDYGEGAYSSILVGDTMWRHPFGGCVEAGVRESPDDCVRCLRTRLAELEGELTSYKALAEYYKNR